MLLNCSCRVTWFGNVRCKIDEADENSIVSGLTSSSLMYRVYVMFTERVQFEDVNVAKLDNGYF